ncbi:MAG: hypothetical protein ABWK05_08660 [Pyrobaculum sp.]
MRRAEPDKVSEDLCKLVYQVAAAMGASIHLSPTQLGGFKRLSPPSEAALKALGVRDVAEAAAEEGARLCRKRAFGGRAAAVVASDA